MSNKTNLIVMIKKITIEYKLIASIDLLEEEDKNLLHKAMEATNNAYSPYSKFNVGCAVLQADGNITTGTNQENIAYPSGLCAERVAIFSASSLRPNVPIKSIAIVAKNRHKRFCEAMPCGACLQVLSEYEQKFKQKIKIVAYSNNGTVLIFDGVNKLLPFAFASEFV